MKIVKVRFKSSLRIDGIAANTSELYLGIGSDPLWGGGPITSMFRNDQGDLCIKKASRFVRDGHASRQPFDLIVVPWDNIQFASYADDQKAEQGKGK